MDLEYTTRSLESEYQARYSQRTHFNSYISSCSYISSRHSNLPNIFQLIQQIQQLETQMARIRNKSQYLIENRQEITLGITKQLLENYQQIKELMSQCQLEPQSQDEDQKESLIFSMEQCGFQGLSDYHDQSTSLIDREGDLQTSEDFPQTDEFPDENLDMTNTQTSHGLHTKSVSFVQPPPPPLAPTRPAHTSTAPASTSSKPGETPRSRVQFNGTISLEEFEKIPSHVRGRCSLHDTQRLLTHLRSEFASKSSSSSSSSTASPTPLNIQQLDQLGYRVCGQTGLCMLKTLQKLGYVSLSKRGDLVSLSALGMQGVVPKRRR
jgi:hypothetical protein